MVRRRRIVRAASRLGTGQAAIGLARELHERRQRLGVEIVGFVDSDPTAAGDLATTPDIIGTIEDVRRSFARGASIASSSTSRTPAANCRWTSCSR